MSMHSGRAGTAIATATVFLIAGCGGGGGGGDSAAAGSASSGVVQPASLAFAGALQPAPAGTSGNVICTNLALGAIAVDSVIVPANAACQLRGTRLTGSILVNGQAVLDAADVEVNGSLQAQGAADVIVFGTSRFGGSVQIEQGGAARVERAQITGDLQIASQRGKVVAGANRITGNLQAIGNRGGLLIVDNTMNGNLQCKDNVPAPVVSSNVAAAIEDQCVAGVAAVGAAIVPAPANLSGNVTCANLAIGAVSLDTVIVPAGARCTLSGTRLIGSVLVGANASLAATDISVNGSVQGEGAQSIAVMGRSSIGGSVQIRQGISASISGAQITGNLQFDAQRGPISATANRVNGNLQAIGNMAELSLLSNAIAGNLQCKENTIAPTGGGNSAALKEDQCRLL